LADLSWPNDDDKNNLTLTERIARMSKIKESKTIKMPAGYKAKMKEIQNNINEYGNIKIDDHHPVAIMIKKWIRDIKNG